nr:hypothetical protein CFP56_03307 [Quercus suber]
MCAELGDGVSSLAIRITRLHRRALHAHGYFLHKPLQAERRSCLLTQQKWNRFHAPADYNVPIGRSSVLTRLDSKHKYSARKCIRFPTLKFDVTVQPTAGQATSDSIPGLLARYRFPLERTSPGLEAQQKCRDATVDIDLISSKESSTNLKRLMRASRASMTWSLLPGRRDEDAAVVSLESCGQSHHEFRYSQKGLRNKTTFVIR